MFIVVTFFIVVFIVVVFCLVVIIINHSLIYTNTPISKSYWILFFRRSNRDLFLLYSSYLYYYSVSVFGFGDSVMCMMILIRMCVWV